MQNEGQQTAALLELKAITKEFPGVRALDNVSITIDSGKIHVILGENGAGKSTLIKCIIGVEKPNDGEMIWNGSKTVIRSIQEAFDLGIAVIYQELNNVPCLSVVENMFINNEIRVGKSKVLIDWKRQRARAREFLDRVGCSVDVNILMEKLGTGQRQLVEVAKALERGAKLIIMDEPTSSLSRTEIDHMLEIMENLKRSGVAIIFITHKLDEAKKVGDVVTVLKDGKKIGETQYLVDVSEDQIIKMMVGRTLTEKYPARKTNITDEMIRIENFTGLKYEDISFCVRKGEMLGIFGLVGAGRTEMVRGLFGADEVARGTVEFDGKKVTINSPVDAIKNGIVYVTENRKEEGLVLIHDVVENASLATLRQYANSAHMLHLRKREHASKKAAQRVNLRPLQLRKRAMDFSGGNQQKIVLSKWILANAKLFIFDEPTKGIDVGAKTEIYTIMNDLLAEGAAIIMITSEMQELLGMSDRIMTMYEGRKTAELLNDGSVTQEQIMIFATGGRV